MTLAEYDKSKGVAGMDPDKIDDDRSILCVGQTKPNQNINIIPGLTGLLLL